MKKFFIIVFTIAITQLQSFGIERLKANILPEESYLLLLKHPAKSALVSDTNILSAEILTTLYNEKNQILVKTTKSGTARLYLSGNKDFTVIEFNANKDNPDKDFFPNSKMVKTILKIDTIKPQENSLPFELDEPPVLREITE